MTYSTPAERRAIEEFHSQPGRKTNKGAGLATGHGGLDCSGYPDRRKIDDADFTTRRLK